MTLQSDTEGKAMWFRGKTLWAKFWIVKILVVAQSEDSGGVFPPSTALTLTQARMNAIVGKDGFYC